MLRWAGVIGRYFDLATLAAAAGVDEDDVLDQLDPALAAGLVREEGIGSYLFGHALVRDALYGVARRRPAGPGCTPGSPRRSSASAGRESETARHWLAAGPAHAGQAWRAAAARPPRPPAGCTPTTRPPSCSRPPSTRQEQDPDRDAARTATTC